MEVLTTEAIRDLLPSILFYLAVGSLGAFSKEAYEVMTKKSRKIRLGEIIVGGLVSAFICVGLSDTFFKNFSLNSMALITFILGGLGFEIFGNLTSIEKVRNLAAIFHEIRSGSGTPSTTSDTKDSEGDNLEEPRQTQESNSDGNGSKPVKVERHDSGIKIIIMTDNPNLPDKDKDESDNT